MNIFCHHLYEYKKGLRRLILHTMDVKYKEGIENKLKANQIDYIMVPLGNSKMNLFFGQKQCLDTLRCFHTLDLNELTHEQDFILGTMLGYDLTLQCERYLKRLKKEKMRKVC